MIKNKKILLGLMSMGLIVGIIVVSSFFPFILDPSRIDKTKFITDNLIITAITISATISMMFISQTSNAQNPASELSKARVEFKNSIARIKSFSGLYQWVRKVLQPNDKKIIAEDEMSKIGVAYKYYLLENYQLKECVGNPQKIDDIYYRKITKSEYKKIISIKKKINNLKFVQGNYYTSVKSINSTKTLSQIATNENAKKSLTIIIQLMWRIIVTLIFSFIMASLVRDLTSDQSNSQAWMTFLSRMFSFTTSSFLGYMLGAKMNDLDAFYIMKRVEVHSQYLDDKTFKEIDEEKEQFKDRVRQEEYNLLTGGENK
jgi:hypothetical protein